MSITLGHWQAFKSLDADQDGVVSKEDLKLTLSQARGNSYNTYSI